MISMELVVLRGIPLGICIVILPRPFDCVAYGFHDCYTLDGLYIKVVLRNSSSVSLVRWAIVGSHRWPVKRTMVVVCRSATCRGKMWFSRGQDLGIDV